MRERARALLALQHRREVRDDGEERADDGREVVVHAERAEITGMKRRKVFPKNWKDHWEGLRQLEWCWDQMFAACAAEVLSGGSLDRDIGFELVMDVPADYGRPCPSTPQEMNRRFILIQRLRLDPDKYILRHIRRIAKREGIKLEISSSGCPLRHASHATSPKGRGIEAGNCSPPLGELSARRAD